MRVWAAILVGQLVVNVPAVGIMIAALFLGRFNEHQVRYLIVGAYAVMKYTEPRYTKDLDIWVDVTPNNASRVFTALAEFGAPMNSVKVEDFANPELVFQIGPRIRICKTELIHVRAKPVTP